MEEIILKELIRNSRMTSSNEFVIWRNKDSLQALAKKIEEAINYTRCCKSDREQFSFADMRDAFDYASVSSQRRDGMTFKEWISKR